MNESRVELTGEIVDQIESEDDDSIINQDKNGDGSEDSNEDNSDDNTAQETATQSFTIVKEKRKKNDVDDEEDDSSNENYRENLEHTTKRGRDDCGEDEGLTNSDKSLTNVKRRRNNHKEIETKKSVNSGDNTLNEESTPDETPTSSYQPLETRPSTSNGQSISNESNHQPLSNSPTVVSYLLEEGKVGNDGKIQPTTLRLTLCIPGSQETSGQQLQQEIRLQAGDDVMLFQDDDDEEDEEQETNSAVSREALKKWPPARVQSFQEREDGVFFTAQWFLCKQDIEQLPRTVPWRGVITRSELLERMGENDIVLSNSVDENEIGAIIGLARVKFDSDDLEEDEFASEAAGATYKCRYQLEVSHEEMRLVPYSDPTVASESTVVDENKLENASGSQMTGPGNEDETQLNAKREQEDERTGDADEEEDAENQENDDASGANAVLPAVMTAEGEGSTLRDSIEIGPEHQAAVPKFRPEGRRDIKSRNPTLVWTPGMYSDEQLSEFLAGVAKVHTPFLDKNRLSNTALYTPVLVEEKLRKLLEYRPERLTGSSLSTSSMLAGPGNRALLRKECDADSLLDILALSKGDVKKAIKAATSDLDCITSAWTFAEKSVYNDEFRRHQGALRNIAKVVAPVKSMQDVVDYHFRFKIPDQFRQYQEKKREIAVRIVECLEEKRAYQPPNHSQAAFEPSAENADSTQQSQTASSESAPRPQQHWSETSVQDVATFTDARRRKARQLMLDVKDELGPGILSQVAQLIRQLNDTYSMDARRRLLSLLSGHSDLHQRFVDFLPSK